MFAIKYVAFILFAITFGANNCVNCNNWESVVQWTHFNFTWPTTKILKQALSSKSYVPENVAVTGIKTYGSRMYMSLPRIRNGVPITLAYIPYPPNVKTNPLLSPYPNYRINYMNNCDKLVSVQSMEIDPLGVMWVLDGMRVGPNVLECPTKLVLIDLKTDAIIHTYVFPEELSKNAGGFLNDIVIDGDYAYITEASTDDPGIIVYSRTQNKAWKLRDKSMFADKDSGVFCPGDYCQRAMINIDGIALSPISKNVKGHRTLYYSPLSGYNLYSISTEILKNEHITAHDNKWQKHVVLVGNKTDRTDGMMMDNKGVLYFGMLSTNGVGCWNTKEDGFHPNVDNKNIKNMLWPDTFAMDTQGNLYVIANGIQRFFTDEYKIYLDNKIKFSVFKLHVGAKSYMYI